MCFLLFAILGNAIIKGTPQISSRDVDPIRKFTESVEDFFSFGGTTRGFF